MRDDFKVVFDLKTAGISDAASRAGNLPSAFVGPADDPARRGPVLTVPGAPLAFHVMAKPTGAVCNLDCEYCFFLSKEMLYPGPGSGWPPICRRPTSGSCWKPTPGSRKWWLPGKAASRR